MWYWRINEGVPGSDMPAWKDALSENAIWLLVDYLQSFQIVHEEPVIGTEMPGSAVQTEQLFNETDLQPSGQENQSTVPNDVIGVSPDNQAVQRSIDSSAAGVSKEEGGLSRPADAANKQPVGEERP
jgi:hypothetical protein